MRVLRSQLMYVVWVAVLLVTAASYWPGLSGPFIFDDFGSLSKLGELGGVHDWGGVKAYLSSGVAGPTGRPISLLSFLLDGQDWPADPWPFKRTNLILHLINGCLLALVCWQLLLCLPQAKPEQQRLVWVAMAAAALWLLHPFLLSTTLYVVQRMAQLAALFCFIGLAGYLHGRRLLQFQPFRGYAWMSVSLVLGTLLATLSKENGALLPVFIWVLEATLLAAAGSKRVALNKHWYCLFILLPCLAIFSYLVWEGYRGGFFKVVEHRGYSAQQRLVMEAGILFEYLRHWFLPDLFTAGLFQDQYGKAGSEPAYWLSVLSVLGHFLIVSMLLVKRKVWPLISFSLLFFYAAHLVESTTVMLELYFEHRNYLAAAFLLLPCCYFLAFHFKPRVAVTILVSVAFMLALFSFYGARLWSNYPTLIQSWAQLSPLSSRAQQQASMVLFNQRNYLQALRQINESVVLMPDNVPLRAWQLVLACKLDRVTRGDVEIMQRLSGQYAYDLRELQLFQMLVDVVSKENCSRFNSADVAVIFEAMLAQRINASSQSARYSQIKFLLGSLAAHQGAHEQALSNFKESLKARPGPDPAMNMAAFMAATGYYSEALELSAMALNYLQQGYVSQTGKDERALKVEIGEFEWQVKIDMTVVR